MDSKTITIIIIIWMIAKILKPNELDMPFQAENLLNSIFLRMMLNFVN